MRSLRRSPAPRRRSRVSRTASRSVVGGRNALSSGSSPATTVRTRSRPPGVARALGARHRQQAQCRGLIARDASRGIEQQDAVVGSASEDRSRLRRRRPGRTGEPARAGRARSVPDLSEVGLHRHERSIAREYNQPHPAALDERRADVGDGSAKAGRSPAQVPAARSVTRQLVQHERSSTRSFHVGGDRSSRPRDARLSRRHAWTSGCGPSRAAEHTCPSWTLCGATPSCAECRRTGNVRAAPGRARAARVRALAVTSSHRLRGGRRRTCLPTCRALRPTVLFLDTRIDSLRDGP